MKHLIILIAILVLAMPCMAQIVIEKADGTNIIIKRTIVQEQVSDIKKLRERKAELQREKVAIQQRADDEIARINGWIADITESLAQAKALRVADPDEVKPEMQSEVK